MIGLAEAEGMRLKAAAYKQYGDAATLSLVLETLPRVRCSPSPSLFDHSVLKYEILSYSYITYGISNLSYIIPFSLAGSTKRPAAGPGVV